MQVECVQCVDFVCVFYYGYVYGVVDCEQYDCGDQYCDEVEDCVEYVGDLVVLWIQCCEVEYFEWFVCELGVQQCLDVGVCGWQIGCVFQLYDDGGYFCIWVGFVDELLCLWQMYLYEYVVDLFDVLFLS